MTRLLAALLLTATALLPRAAAAEELEWPEPIAWGEPVAAARVAQALAEALANRQWQLETDTGSAITARHEADGRMLRLRLEYSPQSVTYHYVDSRNYSYLLENDRRFIHRRANRIIAKLDREVRTQVQRARFERTDDMEVVPVVPEEPDPWAENGS